MADLHDQMSMFWTLIFQFNCWIQLCDKKNLTFADCCDRILIKLVLKSFIKLAKGSLNNIFQDLFYKILSQQLTHDRSYMSKKIARRQENTCNQHFSTFRECREAVYNV